MKKILFVMPKFDSGGAEKSLLMLLNFLLEYKGLEIDLLLFKKEGLFLNQVPSQINIIDSEESLKICYSNVSLKNLKTFSSVVLSFIRVASTFLCGVISRNSNHKTQLRWRFFYKKVIKQFPKKYDIACGYLDGESIYYVVDKIDAEKKFGWNQNDYKGLGFEPKFDKDYYRKLDGIITLTSDCYKLLTDFFPEFTQKIYQIPPIVSQKYIEKCAFEYKPLEYQNYEGYKLISVGRLVEQKGFDIAIEASQIMKEMGLNFRWYIIGNGVLYNTLLKSLKEKQLSNYVFLLGENINPYPYIKEADIFIQPSRFEGKSVILNEAKMLCKPILVTNYLTVSDQIQNMNTGVIVDLNPNSIANGVINMLKDNELRNHLIQVLKNTDFNNSQIKNKYLKLFELL